MADPKHDETFRVIDRRLFNEEGELRTDVPEQDRRPEDIPARKPDPGAQTLISGSPDRTSIDAGSDAGAAPLVGAVTTRPPQAFSSFTAIAYTDR